MSQLDFTRDDFAASRPAGARSVDDTSSTPEVSDSEGADKVQALATEVSASAEGIGPSKPSDLDDDSRATASGLGSRRDEAKFLVEERKRLAGGGRDPEKNANESDAPSKAALKKAGVDTEGTAADESDDAPVKVRGRRAKAAGADKPADEPEATNTIGGVDGAEADAAAEASGTKAKK